MEIKIVIRTDNAAFEDDSEVARILADLAKKLESGIISGVINLRDANGNICGTYTAEAD